MKCRKCLRQLAFLNHPAYRTVFCRDTRFGQRIEQGRFPDVMQAKNAALQAHDIPYESTLFAPSSPMWESWRCPMRAWTDTDWSRRQCGNPRQWFRRLKADIRLGHAGAYADDSIAAYPAVEICDLPALKLRLPPREGLHNTHHSVG